MPSALASSAAAWRDSLGVAITRKLLRAKRRSPGFGVSRVPASSAVFTISGTVMEYLASTSSASWHDVASSTVGPLAMTDTSSPGTSLMAIVTTCAGQQAAASWPPLMRDRCLRTQFISRMSAPHSSSALLMRCLPARSRPATGSESKAEPPPDIKHTTRSSFVRPTVRPWMRCAAFRLASSGTGWAASTISMRMDRPAGRGGVCPYRVTTRPLTGASAGHAASNACAMAPAALPAPTTRVFPFGTGGRCAASVSDGKALRTATQYRCSSRARGSSAGFMWGGPC